MPYKRQNLTIFLNFSFNDFIVIPKVKKKKVYKLQGLYLLGNLFTGSRLIITYQKFKMLFLFHPFKDFK